MAVAKERIEFDPRKFLTKLNRDWATEKYNAGEIIYSQGEFADSVFYVKAGSGKITVTSKSGKSAVPAVLSVENAGRTAALPLLAQGFLLANLARPGFNIHPFAQQSQGLLVLGVKLGRFLAFQAAAQSPQGIVAAAGKH